MSTSHSTSALKLAAVRFPAKYENVVLGVIYPFLAHCTFIALCRDVCYGHFGI